MVKPVIPAGKLVAFAKMAGISLDHGNGHGLSEFAKLIAQEVLGNVNNDAAKPISATPELLAASQKCAEKFCEREESCPKKNADETTKKVFVSDPIAESETKRVTESDAKSEYELRLIEYAPKLLSGLRSLAGDVGGIGWLQDARERAYDLVYLVEFGPKNNRH